jgi:hypothetical protein
MAVHDTPEHILERITFYGVDSQQRIEKHLTEEERILYLMRDQGGHLLLQAVL